MKGLLTNKMMRVFLCAVLGLAPGFGLSLKAAAVVITEDKTAHGDWLVTLDSGETNVVTVAQTGTGKIIKQGPGTLVLAAQNSFTGGIVLEAGFISAEASGCLGSGEITILGQREGYAGPCELWFSGSNMDLGAPTLRVTGDTSCQYPAVCLYGTNNTFSGVITAHHSLYFKDEYMWLYNKIKAEKGSAKWSTDVNKYVSAHFYGAITAVDTFHHVPDTECYFHASVSARIFDTVKQANEYRLHNESDNTYYAPIYFYQPNRVDVFNSGYRNIYFNSDEGLGGAKVTANVPGITYPRPGTLYLCGHAMTLAGIDAPRVKSDDWTANRGGFSSQNGDQTATLLVTGSAANATCQMGLRLMGKTNFTLDAAENPGFTQEITWREQSTSGNIVVRNGRLLLSGDAYFSSASATIVVEENGVLELVGTNSPLGRIASLEVYGRLRVGEGITALFAANNTPKLKLHSGCALEAEENLALTVNELWIDGVQHMKGTWRKVDLPQGVLDEKISVTALTGNMSDPTTTAVWTGAAEDDDLGSTLGNWTVNGEVPAALDFATGSLGVMIGVAETATNLVPPETGMRVNRIVFDRPTNTICPPFVLGAPGRTLVLDGNFMPPSGKKAQMSQLVLRGTITSPYGVDQGSADPNGDFTIYYREAGRTKSMSPESSIYGYKSDYGTPLILDNATINKPIYLYGAGPGGEDFYALPSTVNTFKQHVWLESGGWHVISAGAGAEVVFEGGLKVSARCVTRLGGTIRVRNKPITASAGLNLESGTFVLDAPGNVFGNTSSQNKGLCMGEKNAASRLVFLRSGCFLDNDKEQLNIIGKLQATVDFNVTTQRLSRFLGSNTHAASVLTGGYPAMLEVKGGTAFTTATNVWETLANSVQMAGGLGFHYLGNGPASSKASISAGTDEIFTLKSRAFTTCGDLEVSGGTLELAADASWLNGTNFTARGTGVLKFSGTRQVRGYVCACAFRG
ncbi:MAG: hypothetical protein MJ240_00660 [Kiritimatiellae bacterium]|nr:hypothetical protein [Kiritimatiellia bacterium]